MSIRGSLLVYIAILGGLDALAMAALTRSMPLYGETRGDADESPTAADARPMDHGYALCPNRFEGMEVTPVTAAITYLDAHVDDQVEPAEIRTWFGSVEPRSVDVYKLEQRSGRRRISFEIQRGKWQPWEKAAAGLVGRDVCAAVRAALRAVGVGRRTTEARSPTATREPSPFESTDPDQDETATAGARSRFDFEFIYARRPRLYRSIEWVGTLDHALEADRFVELRSWLNRSSR